MNSYTFSKKLIFLCLFLISTSGFSQNDWFYFNFPDSNATWINGTYGPTGPDASGLVSTKNYCLTSNDTVINNLNYKILEQCDVNYQGALRKSPTGSKVYFVPRDSTQEYLIYDFAAEIGDTIHDVYFQMGPEENAQRLVADVEIIEIDDQFSEPYEEVHLEILDSDILDGYIGVWANNIGDISGFLNPPRIYWEAQQYTQSLTCFSLNDTIRYNYNLQLLGEPGQCALDMSIDEDFEATDIQIYPNPTSDEVTCVLPKPQRIEEILILNSLGKTVQVFNDINQNELTIDLSALPVGLYVLKARLENYVLSKRIAKN